MYFRLLVEFRTRKAHRWVVREKDLLKYWAVMITCVSVYLASGTISTLEHSEPSEHSIWRVWDSAAYGAVGASVPVPAGPANHSRSPHLLFPKSIKGESSGGSVGSGVRVRGDGPRTWSTNASFLLQKARVLRRGAAEIDPSAININGTLIIADPTAPFAGASAARSDNGTNAGEDGLDNTSIDGYLTIINQTGDQKPCEMANESAGGGGGNSLLYFRFQVNSGSYFTVCRQLWWHYVNMAGKNASHAQTLFSNLFVSTRRNSCKALLITKR